MLSTIPNSKDIAVNESGAVSVLGALPRQWKEADHTGSGNVNERACGLRRAGAALGEVRCWGEIARGGEVAGEQDVEWWEGGRRWDHSGQKAQWGQRPGDSGNGLAFWINGKKVEAPEAKWARGIIEWQEAEMALKCQISRTLWAVVSEESGKLLEDCKQGSDRS